MMNLDISNELIMTPHLGGIRLLRSIPNDSRRLVYSVGDILGFPCNAYFLGTDGEILTINENSAFACGFDSTQQALGKRAVDCLSKEAADIVTTSDKSVLKKQQVIIKNDVVDVAENVVMSFLTIKAPVYNDANKLAGIFGFSIDLVSQPLAESLNLIKNLGILSNNYPCYKIDMSIFTPRQIEIINLVVRGRTSKEIAATLKLSKRTVENYIAAIKEIVNVRTKSELIIHLTE